MEKKIPQNLEAEQAVLGSIFLDPNKINEVSEKLQDTDFYFNRHKLIYQTMISLSNEKVNIDYTTICDALDKKGLMEEAGGVNYISDLVDSVPTAINVIDYANIVRDNAILRKIIETCTDIVDKSYAIDNVSGFVEQVEKNIFAITKEKRSSEFKKISEVSEVVLEKIEDTKKNGINKGLDTGYIDLNNLILGFQPTELMIIAARPSAGKTSFALNLALNVAKQKSKPSVAFFCLEMGVEQLVMRLLSTESSIDNFKLRTGNLENKEWERLNFAVDSLKNLNMYFDDTGAVRISDIRSKCRKLRQEGKLDILFIDYLQLLSGSSPNSNRVQEVSEISRALKEIARELKIPVVALSQLSRAIEGRANKKPMMADLRESGSIEQDADIILFLYIDENDNTPELNNQISISVAKNRSGRIGDFKLIFNRDRMTFSNLSTNYTDTDAPNR